tara:strand:- start:256 stop:762 length:507 start_codon:yes stop_codon:yes gene_type:complete
MLYLFFLNEKLGAAALEKIAAEEEAAARATEVRIKYVKRETQQSGERRLRSYKYKMDQERADRWVGLDVPPGMGEGPGGMGGRGGDGAVAVAVAAAAAAAAAAVNAAAMDVDGAADEADDEAAPQATIAAAAAAAADAARVAVEAAAARSAAAAVDEETGIYLFHWII